jgi:hypothetical protein
MAGKKRKEHISKPCFACVHLPDGYTVVSVFPISFGCAMKTRQGTAEIFGATASCPECGRTNSYYFVWRFIPHQADEFVASCYFCDEQYVLIMRGLSVKRTVKHKELLKGQQYIPGAE